MALSLDFSIFLGVQWDYEALVMASHGTKKSRLNLRHFLRRFGLSDRMDDESEVVNEASSRLQTLLSAQAEEITRLLTATVKGETHHPSVLRSSLMSLQISPLE